MGKQYDDKLVLALKRRQKVEDYHGAPVLVKYLPDCDERGAMDPRLYRDQKKMLKMMTLIFRQRLRKHPSWSRRISGRWEGTTFYAGMPPPRRMSIGSWVTPERTWC